MTDLQNKVCPECGKPVQPYNMFCPWCDTDLAGGGPADPEPAGADPADAPAAARPVDDSPAFSCPACGKAVDPDQEYCPWCDVELTGDPGAADGAGGAPAVQDPLPESADPAVGQVMTPAEDSVPAGVVSASPGQSDSVPADPGPAAAQARPGLEAMPPLPQGPGDATIQAPYPAAPAQPAAACGRCGHAVPAGYAVCNMCGTPLGSGSVSATPSFAAPQPAGQAPAVMPGAAPPQAYGQAYGQAAGGSVYGQACAAGTHFNSQTQVPVTLHFMAGKRYKKNQMEILEFQLANVSGYPLSGVKLSLRSTLADSRKLEKDLSFSIAPGQSVPVNLSGFFPVKTGADVIRVRLSACVKGVCDLHLVSEITLHVDDDASTDPRQNIHVNISSSGPLIVDMDEALSGIETQKAQPEKQACLQWVEAPVFWDENRMESEARTFPAACVDPGILGFGSHDFAAAGNVSAEDASRAVISDDQGGVNYLFSGCLLNLGRAPDTNHVASVLQPFDQHRAQNARVSRKHCRIIVRNKAVFIQDISSHGVFLNNGTDRIARNTDTRLRHKDVISIANVLFLEVNIFTDGRDIIAVTLNRRHNKTSERYHLVCRYLPVGAFPGLPVNGTGMDDLAGAYYFHPGARTWSFRPSGHAASGGGDLSVSQFQEFVFGQSKHWLSIL